MLRSTEAGRYMSTLVFYLKLMKRLHVITPVKDSIDSTMQTIEAVMASQIDVPFTYTIYNDFSTPENTARLEAASKEMGFRLINLSKLTSHPSPNYLLVLQRERHACMQEDAGLLIVESDVTVRRETLQGLLDVARQKAESGIVAAATVDENETINYPYAFVKNKPNEVIDSTKHCSFCCSLLTPALFDKVDFDTLDASKNWFDVTISHRSLEAGLHNYICTTLPVLHRPHASRPWKQLKYTNPLKYYWLKWTKGFDKI